MKHFIWILGVFGIFLVCVPNYGFSAQPNQKRSSEQLDIAFDASVSRTAFLGFIAQGAFHCGTRPEKWKDQLLDAATSSLTWLVVTSFTDHAEQDAHMHWAMLRLVEQADEGRRLTPEGCKAFAVDGALDTADGIVANH